MKRSRLIPLFIFCMGAAAWGEDIALLPAQFNLNGPEARQALIVEQKKDSLFVAQITKDATFSSSDENVLKIKRGVAVPLGNGKATITVSANGQTAKAEVTLRRDRYLLLR